MSSTLTQFFKYALIRSKINFIVRCRSGRGSRTKTVHHFEKDIISPDQTIYEKNGDFVIKEKEFTIEADTIGEAYANRIMERLDENDKRFGGEIIKARKAKAANGTVLLEGYRFIRDALLAGGKMQSLFFTDREILYKIPHLCPDAQLYYTRIRHHKTWSSMVTPPGAMAIFEVPDCNDIINSRRGPVLPLTLILDNIRDPGNLGTLIRTAAALKLDRVFLSKGCVDVWDSKVLRSAMGSHFYLPLLPYISISDLHSELPEQTVVHLADNCSHLKPRIEDEESVLQEEEESVEDIVSDLMPVPYFNVTFNNSGQPLSLIIGGETHGLSAASYKLCHKRFGSRMFIPLADNIDSLNSAVAGSIIASEIQRQFIIKS